MRHAYFRDENNLNVISKVIYFAQLLIKTDYIRILTAKDFSDVVVIVSLTVYDAACVKRLM